MRISNDEWTAENPPANWYIHNLVPGLSSYGSYGEENGKILKIMSFDVGGTSRRAAIDVRLLTTFDKTRKVYMFNYQPLQIGKMLDLTFEKNNIHGMVINIGKDIETPQEKEIEVKLYASESQIAETYQKGMQMKDSENNVLAEITDIQMKNSPGFRLYDSDGRLILIPQEDPTHQDIVFRLKVKTYESDGIYYFVDGAAIKVDDDIWFHFPTITIKGAKIIRILN